MKSKLRASLPIDGLPGRDLAPSDLLAQQLQIVLNTLPGTMPWRPDFGCDLTSLVGQPATADNLQTARLRVEEALRGAIPDAQVEKVANRVGVLGSVQTMNDVTSGCALALPRAIERARQKRGEPNVIGLGRMRHALGRHRAHAQLAEHALPCRGLRQQVREARRLQVHRLIRGRRRAAVMTRDAVLLDESLVLRGLVDRSRWRRSRPRRC